MPNHTRPAFTWLFLATYADPKALPVTLRTQADTEHEAREQLAGDHSLTFAAKIRTDCPVFDTWISDDTNRCISWMVVANEHDTEEVVRHFTNIKNRGVRHV